MSNSQKDKVHSEIIRMFEAGLSRQKIAFELSLPSSTVIKIIKNYITRGCSARKKGSGRRRSLTAGDCRLIREKIASDNKITCPKMASLIREDSEKVVSQWTISRQMRSFSLFSRKPALRPFLTEVQKTVRLRVAMEWAMWPLKRFESIIFSDECRFVMFENDGAQRIRRTPGTRFNQENISGTKKFGGPSVMVWGCISYKGVGRIAIVDGNIDSIAYVRILAENLFSSIDKMGLNDHFIFQQDNALCHKSAFTARFMSENQINLLEWPAQSPDLNPIEHVWDFMKKQIKKFPIKKRSELIEKIKEIWEQIPSEYLKKLIESMPQRIEAVIKAKGGNTRY